VALFCLVAWGDLFQARAESTENLPSTVLRLVGVARYSRDEGKNWTLIHEGDILPCGVVVQTARGGDLELSLGEALRPLPRNHSGYGAPFNPRSHPANLLRLIESSSVKIGDLSRSKSVGGADPEEDIRLELRAGTVLGNVRKSSRASIYEVRFPTGVARMRESVYWLGVSGELSALQGTVAIAVADQGTIRSVSAGERFDPDRALVTDLRGLPANWAHDLWLPSGPGLEDWAETPQAGEEDPSKPTRRKF
jgi:hypothetical protein